MAHGGQASEIGNTFIIENTAEYGASSINDFWLDKKNTIVARDENCDSEVIFTRHDLEMCIPVGNPVLKIENHDCVTTIYADIENIE